jgi:hypothetical protein
MGLDSGEAIVSTSALDVLGDRITILEAALEDVEQDLRGAEDPEAYKSAFRHLYAAAAGIRGHRLRATALVRER